MRRHRSSVDTTVEQRADVLCVAVMVGWRSDMSAVSATVEAMTEAEKHQSRSEELKALVATARQAVGRA